VQALALSYASWALLSFPNLPFSIRIMATADGGAYRQVTLDL
jgi:hypothetical protein